MLSTKKSHHNILDEKLPIFSSVLLFGFYMVFEGSLQQALHRFVTFKRIFFVSKSRNAGCWCLSKKMDEQCVAIKIVAMQLFYKLIIFDSKCSSKFKQQLHESHISAFIFHTWAIRLDCDRVFIWRLWSTILHMKKARVTFHRRVNVKSLSGRWLLKKIFT